MLRRVALAVSFWIAAPGSAIGLGPFLVLRATGFPPIVPALSVTGSVLVSLGVGLVTWCFALFVTRGRGTPAPFAPPEDFVAVGPYRRVRNPMYLGALIAVAGEAVAFRSAALLVYGAVLWVFFHLFVVLYEEGDLRRRFGASYERYRGTVPRWIPRIRPG